MRRRRRVPTADNRVSDSDLYRLQEAVRRYNDATQAQQRAAIRLEGVKLDVQEAYKLTDGQVIDLSTGVIT